MADLFDRMFSNNPDDEVSLGVHELSAALNVVSRGEFTATQVKEFFGMDVPASSDFDALVLKIETASTIENKLLVLSNLESAGVLVQCKAITTKSQYKDISGIN